MWITLVTLACTPGAPLDTGPTVGDERDPTAWLHDYWTPTVEICQPPDPFVYPFYYYVDDFTDEDCQQALADDLKIDAQSFIDANRTTSSDNLLEGAYYLLGRDMGTVDQLDQLTDETDLWAIRQTFIDQLHLAADTLGQDRAGPVLYNIVMSTILRTVYLQDAPDTTEAMFNRNTRTLYFRGSTDAAHTATILAHEAAHGWLDATHVACPDGAEADGLDLTGHQWCDNDWEGAWAFGAASARLMYNGVPEDAPDLSYWLEKAQDAMEWQAAFIFEE